MNGAPGSLRTAFVTAAAGFGAAVGGFGTAAGGSGTTGPRPAAVRQYGFTLIEAMVALVVLSVGMIGIAALYGQGLAATRSAQLRTQAVNLAADMADRIRVNRLAGAAYAGTAADNGCEPGGSACTPAQMAAHDLFVWAEQAAQLLPDGRTEVLFDPGTTPPTYTLRVSWDEVGEGVVQHEAVVQVPSF